MPVIQGKENNVLKQVRDKAVLIFLEESLEKVI